MSQKTTVMVSRSLRSIGTLTLVTSVMWTALAIYSAMKTKQDVNVPAEILAPINPNLDVETMNNLLTRRQVASDPTVNELIAKGLEVMQIEPANGEAPQPTAAPERTTEPETASPSAGAETVPTTAQ